jgi:signal transduction histidine kinase
MEPTPQLRPEILVPKLGEYLVDRALISSGDLQRALALQEQRAHEGSPILLGQALVDLGLIDSSALDHAITEQIIHLRQALQATNTSLERRVQERTAELRRAMRRLADLDQLKSNFISNVSHELRTPLTHIIGYLELLDRGSLGPVTVEQHDALHVAQRSATRLAAMVDDLILFALTAHGELNVDLDWTSVSRVIVESVNTATAKAEARRIALRTEVEQDLPHVRADATRISWVLSQLLDNAVKFTPEAGRVVVNARLDPAREHVVISVSDTGMGIPAERLTEVLEPFHQLDGSATRRQAGTGLGLALVKHILEAHDTTLEVESREGKGSRFSFSLTVLPDRT